MKNSRNGSNGSEGEVILVPPLRRINSSKRWCFTFNNYKPEEMAPIISSLTQVGKLIMGKEVAPSTGMKHIQGYIEFNEKTRPLEKFKSLGFHWEKAKGSKDQNIKYCSKEGDLLHCDFVIRKKIVNPMDNLTFRPWQQSILDLVDKPPDGRKIYWFWENVGGVGKSIFSKHLCMTRNCIVATGKGADIKYIIAEYLKEKDLDILIIDLPRTIEGYVSYATIEEVKNGLVTSGKYESCMLIFNVPHVIIFANFPPDETKMSKDRWCITNLGDN